ncbi:MAG: toxin co-regulated pilus biosynthesis Q family protein [Alphaproteobacteria bacterium]|jgi:hypothetical protein|nr:toxin co-regulated pilus biosynthesis Q family protein [Alphaproteobacteria bacterium]
MSLSNIKKALSLLVVLMATPSRADYSFAESGSVVNAPSWAEINTADVQMSSFNENFGTAEKSVIPAGIDLGSFSGGADLVSELPASVFSDKATSKGAAMPLGNNEMAEDDGMRVLSVSSPFGGDQGNKFDHIKGYINPEVEVVEAEGDETQEMVNYETQIQNWVAKEGLTLREVLEEWSEETGWEILWQTDREYPLRASAIFRGRYKDVTSALIKSFSKAFPPPYAKFYLGNKVLVIKTLGDDNG